jgi:polysaccharide chain length determinant protein (PEP-CTERM system associated)
VADQAVQAVLKGAGVERARAIWRRRWRLAVPVVLLTLVVGVTAILSMPSVYESRALVLVDRQQVPEEFVRSTVTSVLEVRLRTISEEILSRSRLDALITRFGLYPKLRDQMPRELIIEQMRKDIRLELHDSEPQKRGGSTIAFSISYRGSDAQTVAHVANALASSYIEENLKARERQATGTADFLRVQLEDTKRRLSVQEEKVSAFKRQHLGELPEQLQTNLSVLAQLNEQLRHNTLNQIRLAEKKDLLELQLQGATPGAAIVTGPAGEAVLAMDPRAARLARLRQELADLLTQFSERYPDVQQAKAQIAALEREIAAAPAPTPDRPGDRSAVAGDAAPGTSLLVARIRQTLGETVAELKALKEEERRLRASIAAHEQRVANAPRREQELQELSRDYLTTRELHKTLTGRFDEAQLAENMEQRQKGEQFRVLDPAVPSSEPAAPQRVRLLAMAVALSSGLAVGLVLLAESLDTSFHSVDELRAFTPAPVLASIPRLVTEADRRRRRRRLQVATAGVLLGAVVLAAAAHLVARNNDQLVWLMTRGGAAKRGL